MYFIKNKIDGRLYFKIYTNEKGARAGKRHLIDNELRKKYLEKDENYHVYLYLAAGKSMKKNPLLMIGIKQPTDDEVRLFNQRKHDLDDNWEVIKNDNPII